MNTKENETKEMTIAELCKIKHKRGRKGPSQTGPVSIFMDEVCVGSIDETHVSRSEDEKTEETKTESDNGQQSKRVAMMKKANKMSDEKKPCKNFKKWWRHDEICAFYKAMMACGINFSFIEAYMGYTRTQKQLKLRYTQECKLRPHLIAQVTQFKGSIDDTDFARIMDSIAHNVKE